MRCKLIVAFFTLVLAGGVCAQEAAKKSGWWIKVNAPAKDAPSLVFYAGSNDHSYGFWKVWNSGDPAEFDIPEEYRSVPLLYIKAQTTSGLKCRLCVMYKTKGVKHFEYDLEEDHEMKQSDEDKTCKD
jgi:hypothetical protein